MNTKTARPKYLPAIREAVQRLAAQFDAAVVVGEQAIQIGREKRKTRFRTGVCKATVLQLIEECRQQDAVLLADYVPPLQADVLVEHRVQFVDACGNAFLRGKGLGILVTGKRPVALAEMDAALGKAFTKEGLKVTFYLLNNEEKVPYLTVRKIQALTGVALGTAQHALKDLENAGFLVKAGNQRRLRNKKELVHRWAEAYRTKLRPKLLRGIFHARRDLLDMELRDGAAWGGEAAAPKLGAGLHPAVATIYAWKDVNRVIVDGRLRRDRHGATELLDLWFVPEAEDCQAVPPLLVYADLITSGDSRNLEAALEIEQKYNLFRQDRDDA